MSFNLTCSLDGETPNRYFGHFQIVTNFFKRKQSLFRLWVKFRFCHHHESLHTDDLYLYEVSDGLDLRPMGPMRYIINEQGLKQKVDVIAKNLEERTTKILINDLVK
uniref:Uncharacterized protein n=1 Tax=Glossina pallidipes TaxID=7398 RepID=A0A1B0ADR0_GLOPL